MTYERYQGGSKRSWVMISLSIALNSLIFYIIFQADIFRSITIVASVVLLFFIIKNLIQNWFKGRKELGILAVPHSGKAIDGVKIIRKYLKINRKYLLATTIGLVLALLVIAQVSIMSTSYRQAGFDRFIEGNDLSLVRIEVNNANKSVFDIWESVFDPRIDDWMEEYGFEYNSSWSYGRLTFKIMLGPRFNFDAASRWMDFQTATTHEYSKHVYDLYSQFPSFQGFEYNNSESLLVVPPSISRARTAIGTAFYGIDDFLDISETNSTMKILVDQPTQFPVFDHSQSFNNITYAFDRVWQLNDDDLAFIKSNNLRLPFKSDQANFYLRDNQEWDLFSHLFNSENKANITNYTYGEIGYTSFIKINLPLIIDLPLLDLNTQVGEFVNEISALVTGFSSVRVSHSTSLVITNQVTSSLGSLVTEFLEGISDLNRIMLVTSVPLILTSLFLLYFSLTIVEKRKEKLFGQMLMRGGSILQIRTMLTAEILIASVLATGIGMGISIPLSSLFLKSSGLLAFNNPAIELIIPRNLYWRLPLLGLLLSLDFNLIALNKVAKLEIDETMIPLEDKQPFWLKFNLDLIFFIISILFWVFVLFGSISENLNEVVYDQFGPMMLLFSVFGFPLVVGRYLIQTLDYILQFLKIRFDILNLAVKNLITNKNFTNKLVALLITSMMFAVMGLVMTNTMVETSEERAQYLLGSDIYVEGIDIHNSTQIDKLMIKGVSSISPVKELIYKPSVYELPRETKAIDAIVSHFIGIDPDTFVNTAYWQESYSSEAISTLVDNLRTNGSTILQENFAEILDLDIGDTHELRYGSTASKKYDLTLNGIVDYFPNFIFDIPDPELTADEQKHLYFIVSLDTLEILENEVSIWQLTQGFYIKLENQAEASKITEELNFIFRNDEEIKISSYEEFAVSILQSIEEGNGLAEQENDFLEISLHSILFITSLVIIIGILSYSYVLLGSRSAELGIYRALGMKRNQIVKLLFYEISIIIFTSVFFGLLAGIFLSKITFLVTLGGSANTIPPFAMKYPLSLLLYTSAAITALSLILAFIPAFRISRKKVQNVLRAQ
ncbi:MAG: ABC transporter permease [Candidatus Heimdallarchaeota archaeon]|nr:ABC transporter permease [Candidatus Heimdallarchaeota archaeon]